MPKANTKPLLSSSASSSTITRHSLHSNQAQNNLQLVRSSLSVPGIRAGCLSGGTGGTATEQVQLSSLNVVTELQ